MRKDLAPVLIRVASVGSPHTLLPYSQAQGTRICLCLLRPSQTRRTANPELTCRSSRVSFMLNPKSYTMSTTATFLLVMGAKGFSKHNEREVA